MKLLTTTILLLIIFTINAHAQATFEVKPNDLTTVKLVNTSVVKKVDVQKQIDILTQQIVKLQAKIDALTSGIQ